MIQDENRRVRCQLAHVVLFDAIEEDGGILPGGAKGNHIRKVVEIMDGTIQQKHAVGRGNSGVRALGGSNLAHMQGQRQWWKALRPQGDLSRSVDRTFTSNLTRFPDEGKV